MDSRLIDGGTDWVNLVPTYGYDKDIVIKNPHVQQTAEGTEIRTDQLFTNIIDQTVNNNTCMYLTDTYEINEVVGLKTNITDYPYEYISYIASGRSWSDVVSDTAIAWYVNDSTETEEDMKRLGITPEFGFDKSLKDRDNQMLFKITLITDKLIQISHWDTYKTTYLTLDEPNMRVIFDFKKDLPVDENNPQVFESNISRESGMLNIYVNIQGIYYELVYNPQQKMMVLSPTTSADYVPNTFRTIPPKKLQKELPLTDSWVSYTRGQNQNNLDIEAKHSYTNLKHNFLITSNYVSDDIEDRLVYNILPLKNHVTSNDNLSRNNPFITDSPTDFRRYTSVNAGGNQKLGYDNIYLNYSEYTSEIKFKPDELTYFHTPPSLYPYDRININDSGLISSGAIAGDQPVRSDKVWKKRANYKNNTHWGDSIDEQSGNYLCTWLYWSGLSADEPVWLDRYYNPRNFTTSQALTVQPVVIFTSTFDNMNLDNPTTDQYVVYDKLSDMCFEPSNLYCYHRIGSQDIKYSIDKLQANLIYKDFDLYLNTTGSKPMPVFDDNNNQEYLFDGTTYASTGMLQRLREGNEISYNFSMYSDDWSKPFGDTIMGNYTTHGITITNDQLYTPVLYDSKSIVLYNTDLQEIMLNDSLPCLYSFYIKDRVYAFIDDGGGILYECSVTGTINEKTYVNNKYSSNNERLFYHDFTHLYIYDVGGNQYISVDLQTEDIVVYSDEFLIKIDDDSRPVKSIVVVNNTMYLSTADKLLLGDDNRIWYLKNNSLCWYDMSNNQTREYITSEDYIFKDFIVDVGAELIILYRPHSPDVVFDQVNNKYEYYYDLNIMRMDSNRTVLQDQNITDLVPTLSAFAPHGKFKMLRSRESHAGQASDTLSLYTEYLSSYTVSLDEGSSTVDTHLTQISTFNMDLSLNNNRFHDTPIDRYLNIENNFNMLMREYGNLKNQLNFQIKLNNMYDRDQAELVECKTPVDGLDPGWHHIAYDYSSSLGKILVFIDGQLVQSANVQPQKYRFSEFNVLNLVVGKKMFVNGIHFDSFLKKPGSYYSTGYKIKNLYIYNKSINYFDIKYFYRQLGNIRDLTWVMPSNSRNYIDEIQHVFQHRKPLIKSNYYDIDVLCSAITDTRLITQLKTDLQYKLNENTPINTQLLNINWY